MLATTHQLLPIFTCPTHSIISSNMDNSHQSRISEIYTSAHCRGHPSSYQQDINCDIFVGRRLHCVGFGENVRSWKFQTVITDGPEVLNCGLSACVWMAVIYGG